MMLLVVLPVGVPHDQCAAKHFAEPVAVNRVEQNACDNHDVAEVAHTGPHGRVEHSVNFVPVDGYAGDAHGKEQSGHGYAVHEKVDRVLFVAACVQEPAHVDQWRGQLHDQSQVGKVGHHRVDQRVRVGIQGNQVVKYCERVSDHSVVQQTDDNVGNGVAHHDRYVCAHQIGIIVKRRCGESVFDDQNVNAQCAHNGGEDGGCDADVPLDFVVRR